MDLATQHGLRGAFKDEVVNKTSRGGRNHECCNENRC